MSLVKYRKAGNKYYKVWLFKIDIRYNQNLFLYSSKNAGEMLLNIFPNFSL